MDCWEHFYYGNLDISMGKLHGFPVDFPHPSVEHWDIVGLLYSLKNRKLTVESMEWYGMNLRPSPQHSRYSRTSEIGLIQMELQSEILWDFMGVQLAELSISPRDAFKRAGHFVNLLPHKQDLPTTSFQATFFVVVATAVRVFSEMGWLLQKSPRFAKKDREQHQISRSLRSPPGVDMERISPDGTQKKRCPSSFPVCQP